MAANSITLLDEIANFLDCTNEQVRHRLLDLPTHERVAAHFQQRLLLTTFRDRNSSYRSLIFEGLTWRGADRLPASGKLRYPFSSKLPQYYFIRHNIRLKYPFHPAVVYTNYGRQQEFYPLELVRLVPRVPPVPPQLPPTPPQVNDQHRQQQQPQQSADEHIYATPFDEDDNQQQQQREDRVNNARPSSSLSTSSSSSSASSYAESLARSIARAEQQEAMVRCATFAQMERARREIPLVNAIVADGVNVDEVNAQFDNQPPPCVPPPCARYFVHWTRLGDGKWEAKRVCIREYANPLTLNH